jgi:3-oxoacyl-[acyl-carrier protein] reductase
MDLKLKGKRALVLGASSGLGRAIAEALVGEEARVAVVSRDEKRIAAAAKEIGAEFGLVGDLARAGEATRLVKEAAAKLGGVDILLVNTGGPPKAPFAELSSDQWQEGFQTLWLSAIEAIQGVLPGMKARKWGRILFVTSVAAKEAMPGLTISNGLRAGILGLTRTLSNEVAAEGITVNALLPGYTRTERLKELNIPEEKITGHIPAGRLGEPDELAALAAFLASERAAYITGQSVACDGGFLRGF